MIAAFRGDALLNLAEYSGGIVPIIYFLIYGCGGTRCIIICKARHLAVLQIDSYLTLRSRRRFICKQKSVKIFYSHEFTHCGHSIE